MAGVLRRVATRQKILCAWCRPGFILRLNLNQRKSMSRFSILGLAAVSVWLSTSTAWAPAEDGKLRIICFGAHPDDCELQAGGVATLWAAKGHHVKLVSVTNGDVGHWRGARRPRRRGGNPEVEGGRGIRGG